MQGPCGPQRRTGEERRRAGWRAGRWEEAGRPSSSGEPAPPAGRGGDWLLFAGRRRRGLACSSAPLPLCPSVLVICPWGGCHHRLHAAPRGAEDGPSPGRLPTPPFLGDPSWCLRLITLGRPPGEAGREGARPPSVQAFPHGFPSKVTVRRVFCSTVGVGWALPPSQPRLQVRRSRAGPLGPSRRPSPLPHAHSVTLR